MEQAWDYYIIHYVALHCIILLLFFWGGGGGRGAGDTFCPWGFEGINLTIEGLNDITMERPRGIC